MPKRNNRRNKNGRRRNGPRNNRSSGFNPSSRWSGVVGGGGDLPFPPESGRGLIHMNRGRMVCPHRLRVVLPYTEALIIAPGTFFQDYLFNLNSIFDPNRTGTGHQPLGYDQWATLYNRYRVVNVRAQMAVINTSTSVPARATMCATNSTTALDVTNASEQPGAVTTLVSVLGGQDTMTLIKDYSLASVNGRSSTEYHGSDNTQALFGASPAETIILHAFCASVTGANVTTTIEVRLWFDVELFDPVELVES